ncbi:hypothetical protein MMC13_006377 [Lambiella insularis]|nr:hypothetical protein [Lambiella insularis]
MKSASILLCAYLAAVTLAAPHPLLLPKMTDSPILMIHRTNSNGRDLKKRQANTGITELGGHYTIDMTLGSDGQSFTVIVDTGSSDLWLLASRIDGQPPADPSITNQNTGCSDTYGAQAAKVSGTIYNAPYNIADTSASGLFCYVTATSGFSDPGNVDGILGLGQPIESPSNTVSGQTGNNPNTVLGWANFGLYISADDFGGYGEIDPNGVNDQLYISDFQAQPLTNTPNGHFTFVISSWSIGNAWGNFEQPQAFVDSGNPTILIDQDSVNAIYSQIDMDPSTNTVDCAHITDGTQPILTFNFQGNLYTIPPNMQV